MERLDDYTIEHILSYLNLRERMRFEQTAKRYQQIVLRLLRRQQALGTTWVHNVSHIDNPFPHIDTSHNLSVGNIRGVFPFINDRYFDWTDEEALTSLRYISKKCPNVTCLHVGDSIIDPNSMQYLKIYFPKLDCVHLFHIILKSKLENRSQTTIDLDWMKIGIRLINEIKSLWVMPTYGCRLDNKQLNYILLWSGSLSKVVIGKQLRLSITNDIVCLLSKRLTTFRSVGNFFENNGLRSLAKHHNKNLQHFEISSLSLEAAENTQIIGNNLMNLTTLKDEFCIRLRDITVVTVTSEY